MSAILIGEWVLLCELEGVKGWRRPLKWSCRSSVVMLSHCFSLSTCRHDLERSKWTSTTLLSWLLIKHAFYVPRKYRFTFHCTFRYSPDRFDSLDILLLFYSSFFISNCAFRTFAASSQLNRDPLNIKRFFVSSLIMLRFIINVQVAVSNYDLCWKCVHVISEVLHKINFVHYKNLKNILLTIIC